MNNRSLLIVICVLLLGILGFLALDRTAHREPQTIGEAIEEVGEEIGDEIDDATTSPNR